MLLKPITFAPPPVHGRRKDETFEYFSNYANFETLTGIITSMFEYENCPDSIIPWYTLYYGFLEGLYCATKIDGKVYILPCSPTELPDDTGTYRKFLVNRFGENREVLERENGVDCIVGYFTNDRQMSVDGYYYNSLLSEIDKSIRLNTIFSRNKTIPVTKDSTNAEKIDRAIKDIDKGKTSTILVGIDNLDFFSNENQHLIETLDLTKPEMMKYLPELNKCYDDIFSRFLCKYGHSTNYAGKMAQMTTSELSGYQSYSKIMPFKIYKAQDEFWSNVNKLYDLNITFDYSAPFQHLKERDFFTSEKNKDMLDNKEVEEDVE